MNGRMAIGCVLALVVFGVVSYLLVQLFMLLFAVS
jgi:hypothetical protein